MLKAEIQPTQEAGDMRQKALPNRMDSGGDSTTTASTRKGSLDSVDTASQFDLEPNPFEQSFANKANSTSISPALPQIHLYQNLPNQNNGLIGRNSDSKLVNNAVAHRKGRVAAHTAPNTGADPTHPVIPAGMELVTTPGGRRHVLPGVAALASPSSLIGNQPGPGWTNSLRDGPLSPALLPGPQQRHHHAAGHNSNHSFGSNLGPVLLPNPNTGGLQTPGGTAMSPNSLAAMASIVSGLRANESGMRTGLTPGGSGSMFPNPGPATAAILSCSEGLGDTSGSMVQNGVPITQASNGTAGGQTIPSQVHYMNQNPMPPHISEPSADSKLEAHNERDEYANTNGVLRSANRPNGKAKGPLNPVSEESIKRKPPQKPVKRKASMDNKIIKTLPEPDMTDNSAKDDMDSSFDNSDADDSAEIVPKRPRKGGSNDKKRRTKKESSEEEKRKSFLERNRIAALKCRQRKKQWVSELQTKVEFYAQENDSLRKEMKLLKDQVASLKGILMAQKNGTLSTEDAVNAIRDDGTTVMPVLVPVLPVHTTAGGGAEVSQSTANALVSAVAMAKAEPR